MHTRKLAHIRRKHFDDGTIGFVLWSRDDRLLLIGSRVPAHRIERAVSHFIRHCGLPDLYRSRAAQGAWVLELFDDIGRRIGWAPPVDNHADSLALQRAVLNVGPILAPPPDGPTGILGIVARQPRLAADCADCAG